MLQIGTAHQMTYTLHTFVEKIRNIIIENRNYSLLSKAIRIDTSNEWTRVSLKTIIYLTKKLPQDEVSLVTYWTLQVCALLLGTICGIFGLQGVTVLISALLALVLIGTTYLNILDIPERILDPTEVVIENVATCLVTFILSWTTLYTLIHY
ncbi:putative Rab5-interacting protein [Cryptosporidium canis]|nr:putative Rab5-interacting protein [Cryptosporidium canis]